ncbi:hypothetical protein ALC53_09929 [Atta colombica]|uniref:Uncharacterized protein n=1 Tax=Atta colombica TaxID=520822 RepID=A0A195B553_9HYME|nr:hypothetical protein ALC53_09929 [Atta colombica]
MILVRLIFVSQRYTVSKMVFALGLVTTESQTLFDHYMRKRAGLETIREAAAPRRQERMVTGGGVAISKNNGEVYCMIPAFVSALQDRLLMFPSLSNPVISPT